MCIFPEGDVNKNDKLPLKAEVKLIKSKRN